MLCDGLPADSLLRSGRGASVEPWDTTTELLAQEVDRLDVLALGMQWTGREPVSVPRPDWTQPEVTPTASSTADVLAFFASRG